MYLTQRVIHKHYQSGDKLREQFPDDLQLLYAKDFLSMPVAYNSMTYQDFRAMGMLGDLSLRVLQVTLKRWNTTQKEEHGEWENQPEVKKIEFITDIVLNWES